MSRGRVLVCDDEMLIRLWLEEHLADRGYAVESFGDGGSMLASLEREPADLVLLDLRLPDGSGIDFLTRIKALAPAMPVIMITAYGEVETAVKAVRAGAHHFLEKPIQLDELFLLIDQALETQRLRSELDRYRDGFRWQFQDVTLVGRSHAVRKIAELIHRVSAKSSPPNLLIRGESGTGKGVVARAVHARGPRATRPFISVNCTALPEHLVESELFGHEAGAYTDARECKKGLLELADQGTIFLDEIGDMPVSAQAKLLGFLEHQRFRRIGGVHDLVVDAHVIAATNRNLETAVAEGRFREDLFYRLNVVPLTIPPLRERPEDITPLALHFLDTLSRDMGLRRPEVTRDAIAILEGYAWPGNVRQLRNVLERILLLEDEGDIDATRLPPEVLARHGPADRLMVLPAAGLSLDELERELICQALERTDGNKTGAARLLGLSRDTLRYRLEKYGIH